MQALFKQTLPYSPLIEPGDRDGHLFVDVTGTSRLFGPPVDVAWRLRKQIQTDLNFIPIWSVAPNKLVAKVATRLVKPIGEYIVEPGEERTFLAPLSVRLVPGIERNDLLKLKEFNLTHVHHIVALDLEQLAIPFGNRASFLYEAARGIDPSPVLPAGDKHPKVVVDHEFGDDTNDASTLDRVLYTLIEKAGQELRLRRLAVHRIHILLDYSDGVRHIRRATTHPPTANDLRLFEIAQGALARTWIRRIRIRHLRLIFDKLVFPPAQLELFPAGREEMERRTNLVAVMDKIRDRFGHTAIQMGRMLTA
jgi:DNA polymerase-4